MMNNYDRIRMRVQGTRIISQLLILCILFFLPEVLFSIGKPNTWMTYLRPLPYVILFYLNYYYLVDKFFFRKNTRYLFFLTNFLLIVISVMSIYWIFHSFGPQHGFGPHPMPKGGMIPPPFPKPGMLPPPDEMDNQFNYHIIKMMSFLVRDGVIMVLTVALCIALKLGEKWVRWDRLQTKLLAERQENELKNLKNQLNPHFLFNTLNNIYSLIAISPVKAQKSVHDLSSLLRYVLYDNNNKEVPLRKDLEFIDNYIELMRLRLTSNVELKVNIQHQDIDDIKIAPLLFISLIENAFKHGVIASKPSFIHIDIHVKDNEIMCIVENSYFPKDKQDKSGSGIGIKNLEQQLSILYPGNYQFTLSNDDTEFVAKLNIKLTQQ